MLGISNIEGLLNISFRNVLGNSARAFQDSHGRGFEFHQGQGFLFGSCSRA